MKKLYPDYTNNNREFGKQIVDGGEAWEDNIEYAFFIERAKILLFIRNPRFLYLDRCLNYSLKLRQAFLNAISLQK